MTSLDIYKQQAAEHALQYVQSGMAIGLGSGTTAHFVTQGLGERLRDGRLREVIGVPTSEATAKLARDLGIPLATLEERPLLDLAIDGADEVDPALNLIKGLGGALLREKIVASSAQHFVVVVDETKIVEQLGTHAPLPIEVIAFGLPLCQRRLAELGGIPELRRTADGSPYRTDEGNVILDCTFHPIVDAPALSAALNAIPSVVEHGLFIGMANIVLVAGPGGVATMMRP
ncbi:MAG TPA: ribose-5-phosphate isomerase RpiA [Roseiflexaceae bacterium]|nr:ribose-5-phosphate isomerase RpiA [Roseiflexaceae bacterium]